jgi:hypothetical protein
MNIPAIKRTNNEPYVIDLFIFSGMLSKNPVVGVVGVVGVVDTFPNKEDNVFIIKTRNQPKFNNTKTGSLIISTIITNKFQKKLSSSNATPQLKNSLNFVL